MNTDTNSKLGALLIAGVGAIHLLLAPEYFGEQAYVGALFVAGGLASLAIAWRLFHDEGGLLDWGLGAAIAVGMGVGFVLSRTVGLPGFHESEWELSGIVSLLGEIGFLGTAALAARDSGTESSTAIRARQATGT
jgi:hypothetical protein